MVAKALMVVTEVSVWGIGRVCFNTRVLYQGWLVVGCRFARVGIQQNLLRLTIPNKF